MTTTGPHHRLPTQDERRAYERAGFLVVRNLLAADVLDAAEVGMRRFYAGDLDAPFPGQTRYDDYDWTPAAGDVLRKNDYASRMVGELDRLVRDPAIGAFAAALAGAPAIRLWHDQLLYKPAGLDGAAANVGWHTDRMYWSTCRSDQMLTCWVPFHDVDSTVGVVSFVPGSHRWPDVAGLDFFDPDMATQEGRLAEHGSIEVVAPDLRRGDVTFHHCRTVHGSRPNLSTVPRRSMAIHLQPADNHWVAGVDRFGAPAYHRNDSLVATGPDGRPDYADPRICPQLYPVPG